MNVFPCKPDPFVAVLIAETATNGAIGPPQWRQSALGGGANRRGAVTPWTLPGGKVEGTEDSKTAMIRELGEETGLKFGDLEPVHFRTESRVSEAK
eukprot:COSAG02_NODE_14760_length_1239_cov_0.987719_1_plen_95_part_10